MVQAIPQYAMSIFKIPLSICKAIERRIANFWWKTSNIKLRKEEGGLGFKDLGVFNKAMLGKQAWRLAQQPNSLWGQLMKSLYFPQGDFLNAGRGYRSSWGWQSLLTGRDAIAPKIMWAIGNGKKSPLEMIDG